MVRGFPEIMGPIWGTYSKDYSPLGGGGGGGKSVYFM